MSQFIILKVIIVINVSIYFSPLLTITIINTIVTPGPHHQSARGAQPSCSPVFRVLRLLFPCCLRDTRYVQMTRYFSIAVKFYRINVFFFPLFCHSESFVSEILSSLCSLVVTSADKNTCTRALWVVSKQNFPQHVVAKKVRITLMFLTMRGTAALVGVYVHLPVLLHPLRCRPCWTHWRACGVGRTSSLLSWSTRP